MNAPAFVHLRMHSEFSVTDGIIRVGDAVNIEVDLMARYAERLFARECEA